MVKILEMVVNACLKSTLNVKLLVTVSLHERAVKKYEDTQPIQTTIYVTLFAIKRLYFLLPS